MKLNLKPRKAIIERGKSALKKLVEEVKELDLRQLFASHEPETENLQLEGKRNFDPKTRPEGSRGLTVSTRINPNGVPQIEFSDGKRYTDYDNLTGPFRKFLDQNIRSGNLQLTDIYKPDGTTFRTTTRGPNFGKQLGSAALKPA